VGGGGLGNLAITYGYYRRNNAVLLFSVVLLILLVQVFQSLGNRAAAKTDKRRQN
jgi:D-methionine transport system permease protein